MLDHARYADTRFARRCALALALTGSALVSQACSSDDTSAAPQDGGGGSGGGQMDTGACPPGGGPLPGMATDACMGMFQTVGMCSTEPPEGGVDAGVD